MFTIDGYKKEILKEFSRVRNIASSLESPWVVTMKSHNIWNCEYVSKIKGIGEKLET